MGKQIVQDHWFGRLLGNLRQRLHCCQKQPFEAGKFGIEVSATSNQVLLAPPPRFKPSLKRSVVSTLRPLKIVCNHINLKGPQPLQRASGLWGWELQPARKRVQKAQLVGGVTPERKIRRVRGGFGEVGPCAFSDPSQKRRKLTRGGVASVSCLPRALKVPQLPRDPLLGPARELSPARIHTTCSRVVCKQRVRRERVAAGRGWGGRCRLGAFCWPETCLHRVLLKVCFSTYYF